VEEHKKHKSLFACCSRRRKARETLELERHRQIMTALENINDAIAKLTVSVDKIVAEWAIPTTGVPEADVNAAAEAVNAQVARLDALTAPQPPPNP